MAPPVPSTLWTEAERAAVNKAGAWAVAEAKRRGASHAAFERIEIDGLPFWCLHIRKDGKMYECSWEETDILPKVLEGMLRELFGMPPFAEARQ